MAKPTKVIERKLQRHAGDKKNEAILGLAYLGDKFDEVHIDPRQPPKEKMDTELHEKLHIIFPDWEEKAIRALSRKLSSYLWKLKYRKIAK